MLNAIEFKNFKAFGQHTTVEFAPITLIFGENSAGKSSILQCLNLLKQTRICNESGAVLLPRIDAGFSDLGSFKELIYDHDTKKVLDITIDMIPSNRAKRVLQIERFLFNFKIGLSKNKEIEVKSVGLLDIDNNKPIVTYKPIASSVSNISNYLNLREFQSTLFPIKCSYVTQDRKVWDSFYKFYLSQRVQILEFLRKMHIKSTYARNQKKIADLEEKIKKSIEFYEKERSYLTVINRLRDRQLKSTIGLDGFIPRIMIFGNSDTDLPEQQYFRDYFMYSYSMDNLLAEAGNALEQLLRSLFPMGPFRRPAERWYIFTGTKPVDVGYKGELLPDLLYREPELVKQTNEWLDKLSIGYNIEVTSLSKINNDLFELRLIDTIRDKRVVVGLSDVGFGVSQILPFIVQSLMAKKKVISIEQPEVHIHPRLQADIGDLLAKAIKEPCNNRFIIETHSEHLMLRLQKLIRTRELSENDVSVIYVSRNQNGASLQRLHLDNNGCFIDKWPGGFFPERIKEIF